MPLYLYECAECDLIFELLQSFTSDEIQECPKCKNKCKRIIGHSSFILKGTGWARDGYSGGTDINTDSKGITARVPIIGDKNTGKTIGTGSPEFLSD